MPTNSRDLSDDGAPGQQPLCYAAVWLALITAIISSSSVTSAQPAQGGAGPSAQHQHAADADAATLFPSREASGTAWLPDETPMHGLQRTWGAWQVMLHGNAFARLLYEPGDKHRTGGFSNAQVSSVNMLMARRPIRSGRIGLRAMMTLQPVRHAM